MQVMFCLTPIVSFLEGSSVLNVGCYHLVKQVSCLQDEMIVLLIRYPFAQGLECILRPCIALTVLVQLPTTHELIVNYGQ